MHAAILPLQPYEPGFLSCVDLSKNSGFFFLPCRKKSQQEKEKLPIAVENTKSEGKTKQNGIAHSKTDHPERGQTQMSNLLKAQDAEENPSKLQMDNEGEEVETETALSRNCAVDKKSPSPIDPTEMYAVVDKSKKNLGNQKRTAEINTAVDEEFSGETPRTVKPKPQIPKKPGIQGARKNKDTDPDTKAAVREASLKLRDYEEILMCKNDDLYSAAAGRNEKADAKHENDDATPQHFYVNLEDDSKKESEEEKEKTQKNLYANVNMNTYANLRDDDGQKFDNNMDALPSLYENVRQK